MARFFESRGFAPAWPVPASANLIVTAIEGVDADGLTPADYHLEAIKGALAARGASPSPDLDADLQILLSDAVATLTDHVRYGKVKPSVLDPEWNVDSRASAPPLDTVLAQVADARNPAEAIEGLKPEPFHLRRAEAGAGEDARHRRGRRLADRAGRPCAQARRDRSARCRGAQAARGHWRAARGRIQQPHLR